MKFLRAILLFLWLAVLLNGCNAQEPAKPILDLDGKVVNVKAPGKLLIINYWASWCDSCKHEIPELNQFYKAHKDKHDVLLYGYEFDRLPADKLKALVKNMGIDYPMLQSDPTKALGLSDNDVQGLPMTFIYDANGKQLEVLPGPQTQADLEQAISAANKKATAATTS